MIVPSKLPKWMHNRRISSENDLIVFNAQLSRALAIAWEALELSTRPEGRYSMDHYQHAKNTIEDSIARAKDALRRIVALGNGEDLGTRGLGK